MCSEEARGEEKVRRRKERRRKERRRKERRRKERRRTWQGSVPNRLLVQDASEVLLVQVQPVLHPRLLARRRPPLSLMAEDAVEDEFGAELAERAVGVLKKQLLVNFGLEPPLVRVALHTQLQVGPPGSQPQRCRVLYPPLFHAPLGQVLVAGLDQADPEPAGRNLPFLLPPRLQLAPFPLDVSQLPPVGRGVEAEDAPVFLPQRQHAERDHDHTYRLPPLLRPRLVDDDGEEAVLEEDRDLEREKAEVVLGGGGLRGGEGVGIVEDGDGEGVDFEHDGSPFQHGRRMIELRSPLWDLQHCRRLHQLVIHLSRHPGRRLRRQELPEQLPGRGPEADGGGGEAEEEEAALSSLRPVAALAVLDTADAGDCRAVCLPLVDELLIRRLQLKVLGCSLEQHRRVEQAGGGGGGYDAGRPLEAELPRLERFHLGPCNVPQQRADIVHVHVTEGIPDDQERVGGVAGEAGDEIFPPLVQEHDHLRHLLAVH
eukprot:765220-Hanusia_phi.AAC.2